MIRLKSEPEPRPRRRPRWGRRLLLVLPLLILAALAAERWRGQRALANWLRDMGAQGEVFDPEHLWPPASTAAADFSNQLAQAIRQLPRRLRDYYGQLSGIVSVSPGQARRGSQEPQPLLGNKGTSTNSWQDLEALVREGQPALQSLRQLIKSPLPSTGYDIAKRLEDDSLPNSVNVRGGAQELHTAAMNDLHQGNLAGTLENLEALSGFVRLYAEDPHLNSFMTRVAILRLSVDVYWDALQAPGWSEPQLARLQQTCPSDTLLAQMPAIMEAERVVRLGYLKQFRSHSYEAWLRRCQPVYEAIGFKMPTSDAAQRVRFWRQWIFHPVWRFAWADQEELHYLRSVQGELAILRETVKRPAWVGLNQRLTLHRRDYGPPAASWRFYISLPLLDTVSDVIGDSATPIHGYPYPDFSRSWLTTMENLTQHEMVKTVIALNRYKLQHGDWPQTLDALIPTLQPALPRDLMDGQTLRYRLRPEGSFLLYSVGEDGKDDGGDPTPASSKNQVRQPSAWDGRDCVWPQVVVSAQAR